jgi:uncharacterized membrane-anchored protein
MTAALRILLIAALQTAALVYMIVDRSSVLGSATTITLKVVPVDPTDMFRGDYVILSYDISRIDANVLPGDDTYTDGGLAYVTLEERDGAWTPIAVHSAMPAEHPPGSTVVRGHIDSLSSSIAGTPPSLRLTYGIESFFVPQGQGKPIEDAQRKGEVFAKIAVDQDGRCAIRELIVSGKSIPAGGF